MNRKETTKFLSNLLIRDRLTGAGKYWAREVSMDYGTKDVKRVDFMQFVPQGQVYLSDMEKGEFICYEIKSCRADFNSGFGRNFIAEKNYFIMPMSTYKEVIQDIPHNTGVMVPVPQQADIHGEFENPTELTPEEDKWILKVIRQAHLQGRERSIIELLFCMLRSGH